jgi:hypothetical protein
MSEVDFRDTLRDIEAKFNENIDFARNILNDMEDHVIQNIPIFEFAEIKREDVDYFISEFLSIIDGAIIYCLNNAPLTEDDYIKLCNIINNTFKEINNYLNYYSLYFSISDLKEKIDNDERVVNEILETVDRI